MEQRSNGRRIIWFVGQRMDERLRDDALAMLCFGANQSSAGRRLKDAADALSSLCRAFHILPSADSLSHFLALLKRRCERRQCISWTRFAYLCCTDKVASAIAVAQVGFAGDQNDGHIWTMSAHFVLPLPLHILQTDAFVDAEADEDDVCFGIGKRPQSVVIFLS